MAIVIHNIGKNRYAYEHYRVGPTIKTKYIGPVDARGNIRDVKVGEGVDRAEIGTTTASLRKLYKKVVRREEVKKVEKHEITIIKEYPDQFNQKVDYVFKNEADADKFLDSIEQHKTKSKSTLVFYMEDGEKRRKRKEIPQKLSYEMIEAEEKAEKKAEIDKLVKENPEFTKSDIKTMFKRWGEIPKHSETGDKITTVEWKGVKEEIRLEDLNKSYNAFNLGRLNIPESWESHPPVRKNRDIILDDPDMAVEAVILNAQQNTKAGKERKKELSIEEAEKIAQDDIKLIRDYVEMKQT